MLTWLRRHRRKLACGGAVVGGLYVAGRLAAWHVRRIRETEEAKLMKNLKKSNHFSSTESTCVQTLGSCYSQLLNSLDQHLGATAILARLRDKPPTELKVRLWLDLKVVSITRSLVLIISSVYLAVIIRVQLNLLAGQLFILELSPQFSPQSKISPKVQEKFLDTYQFFTTQGVAQLCNFVKCIVTEKVEDVQLNQKLSLVEIEMIFSKVFHQCIEVQCEGNLLNNIGRYFIPDDHTLLEDFIPDDKLLVKQMFSDTLDVIESEDTVKLVKEVCKQGLSHLVDRIAQYYSSVGKSSCESSPSILDESHGPTGGGSIEEDCGSDSGFVSPTNVSVHLAKLLPVITAQTHSCSGCFSDDWIVHLTEHPGCKVLGANIYEAFSTPKEFKEESWTDYFNAMSAYF